MAVSFLSLSKQAPFRSVKVVGVQVAVNSTLSIKVRVHEVSSSSRRLQVKKGKSDVFFLASLQILVSEDVSSLFVKIQLWV